MLKVETSFIKGSFCLITAHQRLVDHGSSPAAYANGSLSSLFLFMVTFMITSAPVDMPFKNIMVLANTQASLSLFG